jgi:hypothetical protein
VGCEEEMEAGFVLRLAESVLRLVRFIGREPVYGMCVFVGAVQRRRTKINLKPIFALSPGWFFDE